MCCVIRYTIRATKTADQLCMEVGPSASWRSHGGVKVCAQRTVSRSDFQMKAPGTLLYANSNMESKNWKDNSGACARARVCMCVCVCACVRPTD